MFSSVCLSDFSKISTNYSLLYGNYILFRMLDQCSIVTLMVTCLSSSANLGIRVSFPVKVFSLPSCSPSISSLKQVSYELKKYNYPRSRVGRLSDQLFSSEMGESELYWLDTELRTHDSLRSTRSDASEV